MKQLMLLIVIVYSTIVLTVLLLSGTLMNKDLSRQPLLAGANNPIIYANHLYYIPVVKAGYKNLDISMSNLEISKIVTDDTNIGKLPTVLSNVTYVKATELNSYLNKDYIGVILTSQLQNGFKILSLDGLFYYDSMNNKENYKLVYAY